MHDAIQKRKQIQLIATKALLVEYKCKVKSKNFLQTQCIILRGLLVAHVKWSDRVQIN